MWISLCCAASTAQALRSKLCGPSYALQAKATRVNAVGLNALNKADLRFAEAEVLLSSSCILSRAFQSIPFSSCFPVKVTLAARESAQLPPKRVEPHPILGQIPYTGPRSPDASVE